MYFNQKILALSTSILLALGTPAAADLSAKFDEGAPKDRFTFVNNGGCTLTEGVLRLDLSGSKAGLIFDTTNKGAGVEVFQPLELVSGAGFLSSKPTVSDGDTAIEFEISELGPEQSLSFTIDVDDTAGGREITVSDSEIVGGMVQLLMDGTTYKAAFESGPELVLAVPDC